MAYQFLHIETYARTPSRKGGNRASVSAVFAEARREPTHCGHVEQPRPPVRVYGLNLDEVEAEVEAAADQARDKRGHKLRKDGLVMIAGVASYPTPSDELRAATDSEKARYQDWKNRTIKFLQAEYGSALRSVIQHSDEAFPHLHFYVVPQIQADNTLNLDTLHRGRRAQAAEADPAGRLKAYKEAMRGFQNDFYEAVGLPCGLTRKGPGRRRLTREAWLAEQEQAAHLAKQKAELEKLKADLEATRHQLGSQISRERAKAKEKVEQIEKQLATWKGRAKDAEIHLHHTRQELLSEKRRVKEAARAAGGFNPVHVADLPGQEQIDQPKPKPKPDTPVY